MNIIQIQVAKNIDKPPVFNVECGKVGDLMRFWLQARICTY